MLPETQILAVLSTKMVYPVPTVSMISDHSDFIKNFDLEFTAPFVKDVFKIEQPQFATNLYDPNGENVNFMPHSEILDNSLIIQKTNNIIANKSSEIFIDCIKENNFIVKNENDAKLLLSVIESEKMLLEKTDNALAKEIMETGKDFKVDGIIFDEFFTKELKGEDVDFTFTDEDLEKYAEQFNPGFGTFEELEEFLYPSLSELDNGFLQSLDNIFE